MNARIAYTTIKCKVRTGPQIGSNFKLSRIEENSMECRVTSLGIHREIIV